jgi:hypothetical protein
MTDLFGAPATPDIDAQIREVKRELGQRAHVYPRLVAAGKLAQQKADQQIATMQAVQATLEHLKTVLTGREQLRKVMDA